MHRPDTFSAGRCACGCDACGAAIPAGLDLARARDTELGLYRVELADVPAAADDPAALTVTVTHRSHATPADAEVAISGGRPRCRCASPADLAIRRHSPGRFETAPFSFPSPGWWVLRVTVSGDAGSDAVTFNLAIGVSE
jgi:hypothetical protein